LRPECPWPSSAWKQHAIQERLGRAFGLSFDIFGGRARSRITKLTQRFGHILDDNGLIEERTTEQMYSIEDGRFLPDRYIIGTCPHCGYPRARGDQWRKLREPAGPDRADRAALGGIGQHEPGGARVRHLFLLQSKLVPELREWLGSKTGLAGPCPARSAEVARRGPRRPQHHPRPLLGVPVDRPGFEGKVYYVWFDAPIEYIGATREWADARGEPDAGGAVVRRRRRRLHRVHGQGQRPLPHDRLPCTIIGSREPWKLVDYLKAFNWLTYYGGKFSTSQGIGVFMDDATARDPRSPTSGATT